MSKKRLDELLVDRQLAADQESAKRLIMAGLVFTGQERLDKSGLKVAEDMPITLKQKNIPYVGRGGLKLEKALQYFDLDVSDKIMVDIGSSTGGFTDCALQNGVQLSYAIDVGYNQLAWKLRNNDRVVVMERTNFRYVTPEMLKKGEPNLATIDVSFISLTLILPVLKTILQSASDIIILIKPQFEAKREQVGEKGIVKDKAVHLDVLNRMTTFASQEGFHFYDMTYSPITGGDGNIEFLGYFGWQPNQTYGHEVTMASLEKIVNEAHDAFNNTKEK